MSDDFWVSPEAIFCGFDLNAMLLKLKLWFLEKVAKRIWKKQNPDYEMGLEEMKLLAGKIGLEGMN